MNKELKARLENIAWRADEGLEALDRLVKSIDIEENDTALDAVVDLQQAWLGGIKDNVECLLAEKDIKDHKDIQVSHPSHYNQGKIECIEALKSALGPEGYKGFCAGNVIKYSWWYNGKDGLKDLEKATNFIEYLKEFIIEEGEENDVV